MIYPTPSKVNYTDGYFEFGEDMVLTVSEKTENIDILMELWNSFTYTKGNLVIKRVKTDRKTAVISSKTVNPDTELDLKGYLYRVCVMPEKLVLAYSDTESMLYAFYTLLQLIEPYGEDGFSMKCCDIYDKPSCSFRGIHMCVFPETKLSHIEKMLKLSAFLKLNYAVVEFWGTLKYDALPELAWESGFTKNEIRPIIKAANAMGLKIIPMFNHLGHAAQSRVAYGRHVVLDQNPKLQALFEPDGWTWCISNPDALELLRKIRRELIDLFGNCGYFHLGCDESYSFATCRRCVVHDKSTLLVKYLNSVSEELKKEGIRGIIWGDQFLSEKEFARPYRATSGAANPTHKRINLLDKNLIIDDWQYSITDAESEIRTAQHFSDNGFDVLLSPWYEKENITALAVNAKKYHGIMGTTWDLLSENATIIPQTASEAWSAAEDKDDALLLTNTASILRKLSDKSREYADCGFRDKEIK